MTEPVPEPTPTINEVIRYVKADVGAVGKHDRNTQQNYDFRGIDAVVNAVSAALIKHGVNTVPKLEKITYGTVEVGAKRTPMGHALVEVTYEFVGPAGDMYAPRVPGEAMDSGDKATPKAMSVAYRTALLQLLTLPTDENDPDSQSYERSGRSSGGTREAETEPGFVELMEKEIAAANSLSELQTVFNKILGVQNEGKLARDDGARLNEVWTQRQHDLQGRARA
jgi:hypothetical protein